MPRSAADVSTSPSCAQDRPGSPVRRRRPAGFRVDRVGFARDLLPAAKQRLMPNVDPFVWAKRWRSGKRGQEERTIRGTEAVEPGAQVGFAYPGFRHEFVKPERAADGAAFPIDFR